jgi:hypothetical protein
MNPEPARTASDVIGDWVHWVAARWPQALAGIPAATLFFYLLLRRKQSVKEGAMAAGQLYSGVFTCINLLWLSSSVPHHFLSNC